MALDFLEDIYDVSKLIFNMKRCVESANCSDTWLFSQNWNGSAEGIRKIYNQYIAANNPHAYEIKRIVDSVRENINNPMLCSGIIENDFIPELYRIIDEFGKIDVEEDVLHFTSTKSGLITIQNTRTGRYWHSIVDPLQEAWDKANLLYTPNVNSVVIMGCGLGYLAYQLWKKSFESAHIYIFETNPKMIEYAREFGVLDWINPDQVTIYSDEDPDRLFNKVATFDSDYSRSLYFIADWVTDDADDELRQRLKDFTENQKAAIRYAERFDVNYYNNVSLFKGTIEDLKETQSSINAMRNNEFIVVAAGPSLNKQMDYLRSMQGKKTIIAVDGALKKLLANDIHPDYVTALDPNKTLMHYLDGIEEQTEGITLIADSVVYWQYIANYKGPIYRVCSSDSKLNVADKDKYGIPDLGYHGTVSGLAIEEAVYFGAETVELIGLDLAFPGGKHHADGIGVNTSDRMDGDIMVTSVTGELVGTNATFEKFIREIEIQIERYPNITFVDLSDSGAYIKGTYCGRWYETLPAVCDAKIFFDKLAEDSILSWDEKYYVIRQYYHRLRTQEALSEVDIISSGIFNNIYGKVRSEFVPQVNIENYGERSNSTEFILLITPMYNIADAATRQMLEDAEKFQNTHGFKVIIVNTYEYLCGRLVALREKAEAVESDVVLNEQIVYMGNRYSYVDCDTAMPDAAYIEKVCSTLASYNIRGIISYDPLSLFAEICKKIGYVEYRYGYFTDNSLENDINPVSDEAPTSLGRVEGFIEQIVNVMSKGEDAWLEEDSSLFSDISSYDFDEKDIEELKVIFKKMIKEAVEKEEVNKVVLYYSYLFKIDYDAECLGSFLDYLLSNESIGFMNLDFIYQQIVAEIFLHSELKNTDNDIKVQKLLEKCVKLLEVQIPSELLDPIDREDRNEDFVLVTTGQFISTQHGPTKSALDRCSILRNELHKKVMLINTAELIQIIGNMPFYDVHTPNYIAELSEREYVEWQGNLIPFYQCSFGMPGVELTIELLKFIRNNKPLFVLEIGSGSVFTALVSRILPVLSDAMVPSQIGYFCTQAITCSKNPDENDRRWMQACGINSERVIHNLFTWKLKESGETHTREEAGIAEDAFCIALVGARLDVELTDEFLDFIEANLRDNYCYVLLGRCNEFAKKMEKHPNLAGHMIHLGFVNDTQSYLRLCNVYLNPPRKGGGFSAVEAMINGIPVVALNFGDVAIAAGEEMCCKDMKEIAERITRFADDEEFYQLISAKSKERALMLQDSEGIFGKTLTEFIDKFV